MDDSFKMFNTKTATHKIAATPLFWQASMIRFMPDTQFSI